MYGTVCFQRNRSRLWAVRLRRPAAHHDPLFSNPRTVPLFAFAPLDAVAPVGNAAVSSSPSSAVKREPGADPASFPCRFCSGRRFTTLEGCVVGDCQCADADADFA